MPYCKALYNQLCVNVEGHYKPCCAFADKRDNDYKVRDILPMDFFNSDLMEEIRDAMKDGWHSGCIDCMNNEHLTGKSQRTIYNSMMQTENEKSIEYLDYSTNNQCNLNCRMCSPGVSSKWQEIYNLPDAHPGNDFNYIINNINTDNLRTVSYLGGEPFINKEVVSVIDYVAKNKLNFNFFTNCTYYPKKFEKHLLECESIEATYSIDAIGKLNDYIRHPSDWNTVEKVLHQWMNFFEKNNIKSKQYISCTLQAYNWHQVKEIQDYFEDLPVELVFNPLSQPHWFTINSLPKRYIKKFANEHNSLLLKNYKFDYRMFLKFKQATKEHDNLLKQNVFDYIPELAEVFADALV